MREDTSIGPEFIHGDGIPMGYVYPAINPTAVRLISSVSNLYHEYGYALTTITDNTYDPDYEGFVTSCTTTESNGDIVKTEYTYPFDLSTSEMTELTERNIISSPVRTVRSRNGTTVAEEEREYDLFGDNPVPMVSLHRHRTTSSETTPGHTRQSLRDPRHTGSRQSGHSSTTDSSRR